MYRGHNPQKKLFNSATNVSDRKKAKLNKSWAEPFRQKILPVLRRKEESYRDFYPSTTGRPNHEVNVMLGAILLKHAFDLTDESTVENFTFNTLWHHALDLDGFDCNLCRKTLYNFQSKLFASQKHLDLFFDIRDMIIREAKLKFNTQRLDSVHIKSNMAEFGRFRLFSRTIECFLTALKTEIPDLFDRISPELTQRYLDREGYFCDPKPSEGRTHTQTAAEDVFFLMSEFSEIPRVLEMKSYQLLQRLFTDQCQVEENDGITLVAKPSSDSLQNPSDPDAGYSGHKGKGYQAQVSETCDADNAFEVITHVTVESACESDSAAVQDMINDLEESDVKPDTLHADTSYGGQDNVDAALDKDVVLNAPTSDGKSSKSTVTIDDFEFSADGRKIIVCPNKQEPENQRFRLNRDYGYAEFDLSGQCFGCPFQDDCPGRIQKTGKRRIKWNQKSGKLAYRRQYQKTDEFKEKYKIRSGIEATFSQLKNTHGGKRLKVREFPSVHGTLIFKFMAINVRRMIKHALNTEKQANPSGSVSLSSVFKSLYACFSRNFQFGQIVSRIFNDSIEFFSLALPVCLK
jgi:hypothetical protein